MMGVLEHRLRRVNGMELASRLLGMAIAGRGRAPGAGSASSGTRCLHK